MAGTLSLVRVMTRILLLAAVLAVPVLLAVASAAMTRPPGPPALPQAPIEISFAPEPSPSAGAPSAPEGGPAPSGSPAASASPAAPVPDGTAGFGPDVVQQPLPPLGDDDADDRGDDDGDD